MVFPGQGSQSVGMLAPWLAGHALVRETVEEAGAAIDVDLLALVTDGPREQLDQTANTQPAMLAADVALWRLWRSLGGPLPDLAAGHSLGEFAALVAAGVLDFGDAVRLVRRRGEWMQAAVPEGEGAMAAVIGMTPDALADYCARIAGDEVLEAVNFNAPGQIVVAGGQGAVQRLVDGAREAGARMAQRLPVSVPAHSRLMRPVGEQLAAALDGLALSPPAFRVLHNVDAAPRDEAQAIRAALAAQVHSPVQWVDTLDAFAAAGIAWAGECGPGKVLCGLGKRAAKSITFQALGDGPEAMQSAIENLS